MHCAPTVVYQRKW